MSHINFDLSALVSYIIERSLWSQKEFKSYDFGVSLSNVFARLFNLSFIKIKLSFAYQVGTTKTKKKHPKQSAVTKSITWNHSEFSSNQPKTTTSSSLSWGLPGGAWGMALLMERRLCISALHINTVV